MCQAPMPRGGWFRLRARLRGRVYVLADGPNLIVTGMRTALPALLAGGANIGTIGIGSSAVEPTVDDTALTDGWTRPVVSATADGTSVTYSWVIAADEGPELDVREFGLFANTTLVARKVLPVGVAKLPGVQLDGDWTIYW